MLGKDQCRVVGEEDRNLQSNKMEMKKHEDLEMGKNNGDNIEVNENKQYDIMWIDGPNECRKNNEVGDKVCALKIKDYGKEPEDKKRKECRGEKIGKYKGSKGWRRLVREV